MNIFGQSDFNRELPQMVLLSVRIDFPFKVQGTRWYHRRLCRVLQCTLLQVIKSLPPPTTPPLGIFGVATLFLSENDFPLIYLLHSHVSFHVYCSITGEWYKSKRRG